jgi:RpiR family transcriptional regulator, carbohydrate utilization regulator
MKTSLLQHIDATRSSLRRSEQKVAECVLANPGEVIHLRIVDLASRAAVSEPTVVRFCRAIGCPGFQEFKVALAQEIASAPGHDSIDHASFAVSESDSTGEFSRKVFDATIDTLQQVRDRLDADALERAIQALCNARRVEFYGFGASAAVASDAQHKFFRLRMSTAAYADPHIQTMSAMSLAPGDVVVAISQSGQTRDLLDAVQRAKEAGATVISLTPRNTPLARAATLPIHIDVTEEFELYTPLSSRIAHLTVIDVLAVGVAKRKGPQLLEHLKQLQHGLKPLRVTGGRD